MTQVVELLTSQLVETWIVSLLHSLWLGSFWVMFLWIALRWIPAHRSMLRYGLSCSALAGLVLGIFVTCSILRLPSPTTDPVAAEHPEVVLANPPPVHVDVEAPARSDHSLFSPSIEGHTGNLWMHRAFPVLAVAWSLGCVLKLLRTSRDVMSTLSLIQGDVLDDPTVMTSLHALCRRMRISRPISLKISTRLATPAVWGFIKPVILLPASLLSNLTPQEVEAILAHELAHIRRWDPAVDLLQRLAEAVLFFNPAVWWISRQIRYEREACCDAAAASVIQEPTLYAALLVNIAERLFGAPQPPSTVVTMSGPSSGGLLDRVRRLLTPHYRPELHMSWWVCLLMVVVVGAGLVRLQRGTDVAVAYVAKVLTDEERVELLTAESEDNTASSKRPDFKEMTISGEIAFSKDFNDRPKIRYSGYVDLLNGGGLNQSIGIVEGGRFDATLPAGMIWLFFQGNGVAPAVLGPFDPSDGPVIDDQTLVMQKGVDVPLQVIDERGEPAQGVTISAGVVVNGFGTGVGNAVTDKNGQATLRNVATDVDYSLTLSGNGYQISEPADGRLTPNELLKLNIVRAVPASGVIVDEAGQPVSGVQIREFVTTFPGMTRNHGMLGDVLAKTDEEGQFQLDQLVDGKTYYLLLEHDNFAFSVLSGVRSGDEGLRGVLSTGLTVQVAIDDHTGTLDDQVSLNWGQAPLIEDGRLNSPRVTGRVKAKRHNDRLFASIPQIHQGQLDLTVDGQKASYRVNDSDPELVFEFTGPPERETRQVVLSFETDGRQVSPGGALRVFGALADSSNPVDRPTLTWVPVTDGKVFFSVVTPVQIRSQSDGLIGFWFSPHGVDWPRVESGTDPLELSVGVLPAGAVQGQVYRPNGSPAAGVSVSVSIRLDVSSEESQDGRAYHCSGGQSTETDAEGKYFLTPIPMGARYDVSIGEGFYRQVSEEFVMSAEDVAPSHSIVINQMTELSGQVLDPEGNPAGGFPVSLSYDRPPGGHGWGPPQLTDANGRFTFPGVNARPLGAYTLSIENRPGIQPLRVPLKLEGPNTIRLKRGLNLAGRVLDTQGLPVPGVEVFARILGAGGYELPPVINADSVTDEKGRFRFSTLPALPVKLGARQLWNQNEPTVQAGRNANVTIQGEIAPWYAEKLEAPSADQDGK